MSRGRQLIYTSKDVELFKSKSGKTYGVRWKGHTPHYITEGLGIKSAKFRVSAQQGFVSNLSEENARVLFSIIYKEAA